MQDTITRRVFAVTADVVGITLAVGLRAGLADHAADVGQARHPAACDGPGTGAGGRARLGPERQRHPAAGADHPLLALGRLASLPVVHLRLA